ncbi:MAG: 50S ribosomal protein L3 [Ignavibacteriales bacterium CG12_big_fil_rev_8_21_14_0_65_30_8]|nr:MAG: 50S ribosomal protein L3 [Ignavibacteriales bacterium CG12_big_fil_rev_8_21_14_0_65_30_8]
MSGILGRKIGMSSVFGPDGQMIPVTVIKAGPCRIVNIKTKEKDGYEALQFGFETRKEKNTNKPLLGYYKKNNIEPASILKEFRFSNTTDYKIGDELKADFFTEGEKIKVRAKGKGKGFQGVMKRHGFSGVGGTTHGQSDRLRAPGSIGQSSDPSRVMKGMRMAGRTGGKNISVTNLQVVKILPEENIILVNGSVPGSINSIVELIKK